MSIFRHHLSHFVSRFAKIVPLKAKRGVHSRVVTSKDLKCPLMETFVPVTRSHRFGHRDLKQGSAPRETASVSNLCVIPGSVCSAHFTLNGRVRSHDLLQSHNIHIHRWKVTTKRGLGGMEWQLTGPCVLRSFSGSAIWAKNHTLLQLAGISLLSWVLQELWSTAHLSTSLIPPCRPGSS